MIFYIYLGYPFLIFLISFFRNKKIKKGTFEPSVTILIAAYNEEACIGATIKNKLHLDYPKDKLEILVISDSSSDSTDNIVNNFKSQKVRLLRQAPRAGKTSALNMAVPEAKGDILVFSDANSLYAPNALRKLVQNFYDPEIGYVSGKMIYSNPDGSIIGDGCSTYMKYENLLRSFETKTGSIVGVDGGIDAVRKNLYRPMNPDQLPDFVLPLDVVQQNYRVVYEPDAVLKEPSLKTSEDEYRMRVRVSLRALWALSDMRQLLSFKSYGLFSLQLWSHKVLRYLCFAFFIGAYFSNLILFTQGTFYQLFFLFQTIFFLTAITSLLLELIGIRSRLLYLSYYIVLLNLASFHAFIKFLFRQKQVIWEPRKGA